MQRVLRLIIVLWLVCLMLTGLSIAASRAFSSAQTIVFSGPDARGVQITWIDSSTTGFLQRVLSNNIVVSPITTDCRVLLSSQTNPIMMRVFDLKTSTLRSFLSGRIVSAAHWSPDERFAWLEYFPRQAGFGFLDSVTGEVALLDAPVLRTNPYPPDRNQHIAWSPDVQMAAVHISTHTSLSFQFLVDIHTGATRQLNEDLSDFYAVDMPSAWAWSSDSRYLLRVKNPRFSETAETGSRVSVLDVVDNVEYTLPDPLIDPFIFPAWLPDDRVIMLNILAPEDSHYQVYVWSPVTGALETRPQRIARFSDAAGHTIGNGIWSPDRTKLAYVSGSAFQVVEIVTGRTLGSLPIQRYASLSEGYWSPDSRYLIQPDSISSGGSDKVLTAVNILDTVNTQVTRLEGLTWEFAPRWSPDGQALSMLDAATRTFGAIDFSASPPVYRPEAPLFGESYAALCYD